MSGFCNIHGSFRDGCYECSVQFSTMERQKLFEELTQLRAEKERLEAENKYLQRTKEDAQLAYERIFDAMVKLEGAYKRLRLYASEQLQDKWCDAAEALREAEEILSGQLGIQVKIDPNLPEDVAELRTDTQTVRIVGLKKEGRE